VTHVPRFVGRIGPDVTPGEGNPYRNPRELRVSS
jgi:hypothetical protein